MTSPAPGSKTVIVISDCHLSAGHHYEGQLNPYEDFHFDDEMVDLFHYFSTGAYGTGPNGPVEVSFFINGDFLDFLNVPINGEFDDAVTEELAIAKCDAILTGHPKVMKALRNFASQPGKSITYLIGNHDADLFFEGVRERIVRAWDPDGNYPSPNVRVLADRDRVAFDGGLEIHHGNQFEAVHVLDFERPLLKSFLEKPVLNLPWGSLYVLKIVNRLKSERPFLDKVRPVKVYVLFGLLVDTWFTLKYVFLSVYYFLMTRFVYSPKRQSRIGNTAKILRQETNFLLDLEREARQVLDARPELKTLIFGHTHKPMHRVYPDGKQYLNTGTWTRMVNLDWERVGQQYALTFAHVVIPHEARVGAGASPTVKNEGVFEALAQCELRQWYGEQAPHRSYRA